ncbi:MAG: pimeloyl-ACP methyl ester carboxylesterase [Bacteroidia bacterium]|jgi:pimeloyl-ACP methyl ester carboxylesterase
MPKVVKLLLWLFVGLLAMVKLSACFQFRDANTKVEKEYALDGFDIQTKRITTEYGKVNFIRTNFSDSTKPIVIFVHGSPGSSNNFNNNLRDSALRSHFEMISVDRLGFGHSEFGHSEPSLFKQAAAVNEVVKLFPNRRFIVVGHSYGGPVAAKMAMDYPENIYGLVLAAGSIDPSLEPKDKWRKPANSKLVRWMLPRSLVASNQEILPLKEELTLMLPQWEKLTQPVTVIQGLEDELVLPENADFAQRVITNSIKLRIYKVPNQNHFIPFQHHQLITDALIELLPDLGE